MQECFVTLTSLNMCSVMESVQRNNAGTGKSYLFWKMIDQNAGLGNYVDAQK